MRAPTVTALLAAWASSTCAGCTDHTRALQRARAGLLRAEQDRARQRDEIAALEHRIAQLLGSTWEAA